MKFSVMILIVIISLFITKYGRTDFLAWQNEGSYKQDGDISGFLPLKTTWGFPLMLAMASVPESKDSSKNNIDLPKPKFKGSMSVEETIKKRRQVK